MSESGHDHGPTKSYLGLLGIFHAGLTAVATRARARSPRRMPLSDLILCGVAAHEMSHLLATDAVTRPLRAPFTEERRRGGGSREHPVSGDGPRRALGQLITCRYCVSPWASLALVGLYQLSPSAARVTAGVLSAAAISDYLHWTRRLLARKARELESAGELLNQQAELGRMPPPEMLSREH